MYHLNKTISKTGEIVTLNETSKTKFKKIKVFGNSIQETRSGKNIFNNTYNNLAMWNTGAGETTTFAEGTSYLGAYCEVEEGKTYSISKAKTTARFIIAFCNEVPTVNSTALVQYRNDSALKIENIKVPEGYSYLVLYLSNSSETFEGLDLQIEEGKATTYEPYGAMPSPEFPSEIQNVNGNVNTTVCNKNLLYDGWAEDFVERIKDETRAKIEVINGKKYLNYLASAGYVAGQNYKDSKAYFIKGIFKEKTQYTFSCKLMLSSERKDVNILVRYTDGTSGFIYLSQNAKPMEEVDYYVTTNKNKTLYSIGVHYQTDRTYIDLSTVTLKEGNNSNYIEPQSQKITFPLSEGQRLYEGSYLADDGIHHKRGQDVFDGSDDENWKMEGALSNATTTFFQCYRPENIVAKELTKGELKCSHFKNYNCFAVSNIENGMCIHSLNGFQIRIENAQLEDVSVNSFKKWLSENPVTIEYPLAEEVIEPYTEEQQNIYNKIQKMYSYDNFTNIFSINEISPVFEVEAYLKISEEIKTRLLTGKVTRGYLKVLATDTQPEIILNEENYLKDVTFEELRYVPEEGFIGGVVAKRVTGNLNNVDSNFSIQDREFELYFGVDLEDGTTEYIKYGTFIVQRPEDNQVNDNTTFEALDYMIKLNLPWIDNMTYPCTLKQLFDDLVAQSGLSTKVTSFLNEDFIVENNQFEAGTSRREVLKAIAQMAFNWARVDEDNEIVMDFEIKDTIDETMNADNYYNLSKQELYGPVNVIVLRNSQVEGENITIRDEDSINQYGETELVIADNPFAYTQAKRAELIEAGRYLFGLKYIPLSMEMIGYMYLNCKDKIKVQSLNNETFDTYLLNHTIQYQGVISDSMESPAKTKTATKYQFTPDLIKQMRRTEIIVDKANENITLISENLSATNDKVAQLRIDKDRIEAEVNNINKEIKDANGNIVALTSTTEKLTETIEGLTNTLTNTGGINLIKNSVGVFDSEYWEGVVKHYTDTEIKNNTTSGHSILLQNGTITQIVNLKNGFYNISFVYKKLKELAECKIKINDFGILLEELELTNYEKVIEVTNNAVKIEIISDTDDSCYVSDLLLISGTSKQEWTQNINETVSDTVKIGKGIEITSTTSRTKLIADSESVRINNTTNNETVAEFTSTGTTTKNLVIEETAQIAGLLIKKNGNQTWISSLL